MRKRYRLRLLFVLLRPSILNPNGFCFAELSASVLVTLSKPWLAHYKTHYPPTYDATGQALEIICFMVDQAGVEPASRTPFLPRRTTIILVMSRYVPGLYFKRIIPVSVSNIIP